MPEIQKRDGMFAWTDLASPDPTVAKAFYGALFDWEAEDVPAGDQGVYTLFSKGGKTVAGLGGQPESMQGMPAVWTSYVSSSNVDEVAAKVEGLGGTVTVAPMDVMDAGRMAMIQDPTGATLGVWQAGNHTGADIFNEHGAMSWNELATRDVSTAKAFFERLLGWAVQTGDIGGGNMYTGIFLDGDHPNGGMIQMDEKWPQEIPPHWMTYFTVDDVDAAAAKVEELGGAVKVPPRDIPVGRFSVVSDPQGGTFTIITMAAT